MRKEFVMFDFDGTLVPTSLEDLLLFILKSIGITDNLNSLVKRSKTFFNEEKIKRYDERFLPAHKLWTYSLRACGINVRTSEVHRLAKKYYSNKKPFKDVPSTVCTLHERGYNLSILSGTGKVYIEEVLKAWKLRKFFTKIITHEDVRCHKPMKEFMYRGLKILKAKPEQAIYVGNSVEDVSIAKACNVTSALILRRKLTSPLPKKPDFLISNLSELSKILQKLNK